MRGGPISAIWFTWFDSSYLLLLTLQCLPFCPSWTHQNQFVLSLADLTWPLRQSEGYKHSSSQRLKICHDHHLNRLIRLLMFWGAKKWIKCAINPYWCFCPHLVFPGLYSNIPGPIIQSYTTVCWHNLIHLFYIKLKAPPNPPPPRQNPIESGYLKYVLPLHHALTKDVSTA